MSNERIDVEALWHLTHSPDLTDYKVKDYEEEYNEMQDMAPSEYLDRVLEFRSNMISIVNRCYDKIDELEQEPSVTIDEWDDERPCVTVRYNGREYVGTLEEWESEEE